MTQRFTNGVSERETERTEVVAKASRRRFSTKYKLRILAEMDECTQPGQRGALMRREGLYWSTVRKWRQKRDEGVLSGLSPKKRGPKPNPDAALVRELVKKEKQIEKLEKKLQRAEMIIGVQKKVSELLGITLGETNDGS
jgi:transposase-like protein